MNGLRDRGIAIVGYADTKLARRSGKTVLQLAGEVLQTLLERTGIERERIDGLATTMAWSEAGNAFYTSSLAEGLGLSLTWSQVTDIGGASPVGNVARAAAAIDAGLCEMVLCLGADAVTTQDFGRQTWYRTEYLEPAGYSGPLVEFALLSSAYAGRSRQSRRGARQARGRTAERRLAQRPRVRRAAQAAHGGGVPRLAGGVAPAARSSTASCAATARTRCSSRRRSSRARSG